MGFLNTVKGWFNIGGVKVRLQDVNPVVSKSSHTLGGTVVLTSKSDKQVLKMIHKFVLKRTSGGGEDKKTEEFVLGESRNEQPFDIKAGETKSLPFTIPYSLDKELKDMGGALGAIGKLGAFAVKEKDDYFVIAECDVKGTPFDPTAEVAVKITD